MKKNAILRKEILAALQSLNTSGCQIGVAVQDGFVTLSGKVDSFGQKAMAEKAACSIDGIKILALYLQVGNSNLATPVTCQPNITVTKHVWQTFEKENAVINGQIAIKVDDSTLVLEGTVDDDESLLRMSLLAEQLYSVRTVINHIHIRRKVGVDDIVRNISAYFPMHSGTAAPAIHITVDNNSVKVYGKVNSLADKQQVENACWEVPGVIGVDNFLTVDTETTASEKM